MCITVGVYADIWGRAHWCVSVGIYGNGNLTYHLYLEKNPLQHGEKEREKDMPIESKHCRAVRGKCKHGSVIDGC